MTTDTITLRRAAEQARSALNGWANHGRWAWPESALQTCKQNTEEALAALDAALAEPEQKPEPVAVFDEQMGHPVLLLGSPMLKDKQPLYTAPPEPQPATVEQVIAAHGPPWGPSATADFFTGFREAERFHGIVREDK